MKKPTSIATADCHTCNPWSRFWRTASGSWQVQERHEDHCNVYPRVQRNDYTHAAHAAKTNGENNG